MQALLEHDWPDLEDLDLSCNDADDEALRALARTKQLPRLRYLDLANRDFGDRGLADLAKAERLSLRSLAIGGVHPWGGRHRPRGAQAGRSGAE